jgi:hypothetical protein
VKAYVITTGSLFALIVAAHIWRAAAEGWGPLKSPFFLVTTTLAVAIVIWAWRVLKGLPRR